MQKRALFVLFWTLFGTVSAQQTSVEVRVFTEPAGPKFSVDGTGYSSAAVFFWQPGTRHTLRVAPEQIQGSAGVRSLFQGWNDSSGRYSTSSPEVTVTAGASVTQIVASFQQDFRLHLNFREGRGTVYVNGAAHSRGGEVWVPAGETVRLSAVADPGYVFMGWGSGTGADASSEQVFVMSGTRYLYPRFEGAVSVTLTTSPPRLMLAVDRTPMRAPQTFGWGQGTQRTLSPVSPQTDERSGLWVFDSWSDGGADIHLYTVPATNSPVTVTATYAPGARASFVTVPPGLRLSIDGRENWPAYNFVWGVGSKHTAEAPAEQTGNDGWKYLFRRWSNGGPASQEVTVGEAARTSGVRLVAEYESVGKLLIRSVPGPVSVVVDGADCATPCVLEGETGKEIRIAAPAGARLADGTRVEFESWSDGGAREAVRKLPASPVILTAHYRGVHGLQMVMNAAGPTPEAGVAPGSIISLYGSGLALAVVTGPDNPLSQTLGGVTVLAGDRMLPLFIVSPDQINALLPSDMGEGEYTAVVRREGQADAQASFQVVRNAPGLFTSRDGERVLVTATHEDGNPVTVGNPARPGEMVTVFGTGFGPTNPRPPDGFPVPSEGFVLVDPAEVIVGEERIEPEWACAARGYVGVNAVRFKAPAETAEVKVRFSGKESNAAFLPVK